MPPRCWKEDIQAICVIFHELKGIFLPSEVFCIQMEGFFSEKIWSIHSTHGPAANVPQIQITYSKKKYKCVQYICLQIVNCIYSTCYIDHIIHIALICFNDVSNFAIKTLQYNFHSNACWANTGPDKGQLQVVYPHSFLACVPVSVGQCVRATRTWLKYKWSRKRPCKLKQIYLQCDTVDGRNPANQLIW